MNRRLNFKEGGNPYLPYSPQSTLFEKLQQVVIQERTNFLGKIKGNAYMRT